MSQEIYDKDDNYDKVNTDTLLLMNRVDIVKDKIDKTPWYRIGTLIKLRKELNHLGKETDKIGERLERLNNKYKNPIQIVKRE